MMLTRRALLGSSLAFSLSACASAPRPTGASGPRAAIGAWGVDLELRDPAIAPGDDFYRHVNGRWMATQTIPSDRARWGVFDMLDDAADRHVRAIIEETARQGGAAGTNARKIGDFYNSYLDLPAIEARGIEPARADLNAIFALRDHAEAIRLIGRPDMPVSFPIALYVDSDSRDPDRYAVYVTHGGLGLGEREFYRRSDGQFPSIRAQYVQHIERMFTLAQIPNAAAKARAVLALETQIAERHWPVADRRERDRTYNQKTRAELRAIEPRFPWDAALESAELGAAERVVVAELSAMGPLARLYLSTPLDQWKAYLAFHYLSNTADVLPAAFDAEHFAFFRRTLNGQPQQRERWQRGVDAVNGALGEAVGEIYVQQHFSPRAREQMIGLVENLRRAYGERIDQLSWMGPATRAQAREKLAAFRPKIGYPSRWRDYSALEVRAGDAFGNALRAGVFEWRRKARRLNQPTDREEWFMTPQTVNAYYNPDFNEICFPAAILQAPFFDEGADSAVNYGAIGGVIGHEMGHGFDDQGARSDARGVLRDWWTAEDFARFRERTGALAAQYNAYEPLPGIHVNGQFTLGENIGDNGGLQVALHAYRMALGGALAPVLDGMSGEQRFFLSWAQAWRTLIRDERLRNQVLTDPHSPAEFRCNGVVRNMDAWYEAFNVQPGARLYLPPEQRVTIW